MMESSKEPSAILLYFHGFNSHGGVSAYYGVSIAKKNNMNTYAIDFNNFGIKAGNSKGEMVSLKDFVEQADAFMDHILGTLKSKPKVFISGCSFGGTISFELALLRPK